MPILESDGHGKVCDYLRLEGEICEGCGEQLTCQDSFEALVDRITHRGYLIHTNKSCWDVLESKLKGENNGNLPSWAQF